MNAAEPRGQKKKKKPNSEKTIEDDLNNLARWTSDICPLCNRQRENTKHVPVCPNQKATDYRTQEYKKFIDWMTEQRTDSFIIDCIKGVLLDGFDMTFYDCMKNNTTDDLYLRAAREQDMIGRHNFLLGRISSVWKELQRRYLLRTYPKKNFSADAWVKRFIGKLYRTMSSIWRFRCDQVHGAELAMTSKREQKALRDEIKKQFNLGPKGVRAVDRDLFLQGQNALLQSSVREQKYWVRTIKISRTYFAEAEKNMFIGMRYLMRNWTRPPD